MFSWSHRHLPPAAARAFDLLGLHPGRDIDAAAVAALAGCDLAGRSARSTSSPPPTWSCAAVATGPASRPGACTTCCAPTPWSAPSG
ncbi:hypothetical protein ACFQX7_03555 [Luedemannella flava]